jgi:hypothetical protein
MADESLDKLIDDVRRAVAQRVAKIDADDASPTGQDPTVEIKGPSPDGADSVGKSPTPGTPKSGRSDLVAEPVWRRLRIFAVDPSASAQVDTASIAEVTIAVPWEELDEGPIGEYIEVVDADPASGCFYKPVHLNDPHILAEHGLPPSESNPQFHQQMCYAVAMSTIRHFEKALGRVALWSSRRTHPAGGDYIEEYVPRLRIYPHALRDRNAYYSPEKKAMLFGYFPVGIRDANNIPGTIVFTCLSHDIVAHETTHALLDGVHPRFNEPVNADVLAFHEAFADIVAMFQHFGYPGLLRDQINRTRGDLRNESMLGQIAQQFGQSSGRGQALRDFLGEKNEAGQWELRKPDVHTLEKIKEPHGRGAILVAAVFGAFLKVYRSRTLDLYRIASEGTGILREGAIHPDLANRLATEAAECARRTLQICIRAIDYCPPVGITFGDYLRAIVTGGADDDPEDEYGIRLAFTESFRQWGITPAGLRSMSVESLLWPTGEAAAEEANVQMDRETFFSNVDSLINQDQQLSSDFESKSMRRSQSQSIDRRLKRWNLTSDRYKTWEAVDHNSAILHAWLVNGPGAKMARAFGLVLGAAMRPKPTVFRSTYDNSQPAVEVHSVRWALRRGARGEPYEDLVVEITQRRRGFFDEKKQAEQDALAVPSTMNFDFTYRAGCTLLINPKDMQVRRVIKTPGDINDDMQLNRMRRYLMGGGLEPPDAFAPAYELLHSREPFALLHRETEV